jgi:hypothetical protein
VEEVEAQGTWRVGGERRDGHHARQVRED